MRLLALMENEGHRERRKARQAALSFSGTNMASSCLSMALSSVFPSLPNGSEGVTAARIMRRDAGTNKENRKQEAFLGARNASLKLVKTTAMIDVHRSAHLEYHR